MRPRVFMCSPTYTLAMTHTGVVAQAAIHVDVRRAVQDVPPGGRRLP